MPNEQLTIDFLKTEFKVPCSKTLKTDLRAGTKLVDAIHTAYRYVQQENQEGYNRVEFKYDNCYFVVARLKEEL